MARAVCRFLTGSSIEAAVAVAVGIADRAFQGRALMRAQRRRAGGMCLDRREVWHASKMYTVALEIDLVQWFTSGEASFVALQLGGCGV